MDLNPLFSWTVVARSTIVPLPLPFVNWSYIFDLVLSKGWLQALNLRISSWILTTELLLMDSIKASSPFFLCHVNRFRATGFKPLIVVECCTTVLLVMANANFFCFSLPLLASCQVRGGANVIKLFCLWFTDFCTKLECLSFWKLFQPSLTNTLA